ncbi:hypothetical protein [Microvirga aerophila]|uniref:Uncharacterized protein n=1 Tax=Microvirga aerophila TaxID=670291 RepID=A0A512BM42_9HYPH|nr:hypothetical protein [Microvirga aerophila]GEO13031.1 hypothetical protein MAE02_07270 [Microvirga aerophila]
MWGSLSWPMITWSLCSQSFRPQRSAKKAPKGGWFLEAGFGPCSAILTTTPPIFARIEEAQSWVYERVTQEKTARS